MTPSELAKVAEFLGRKIEYQLVGHNRRARFVDSELGVWSAMSDADLTMALLEKLAEKGLKPKLTDYGDAYFGRYECSIAIKGWRTHKGGPTWLDAVVAAVLEVVK